jgi:pilus assembly protein CpaE
MAQNKLKIILARMDEAVRQDFKQIISSLEGCSLYDEKEGGIADLLIMELGENAESEFSLVHQAIHSGVAAKVYLTSRFIRPEVLIEAMRAGVKEFFSQPLKAEEVQTALIKLLHEKTGPGTKSPERPVKQGRIFSVIGSKGGVGTTTVSVNLATCLKEIHRDKTVALIDMNLIFGEVPLFLGMTQGFDWAEVAKNIHRLDYTYLMSVMAHNKSGLYVLPSPVAVQDEFRVGPDIVANLLIEMKSMFDFIVVDAGQSVDYFAKAVFKISDLTMIVTLLTLPCLINVKRILDTFSRMGYPADESSRILVNRFLKRSFISEEDAAKTLQKPIFMNIPNDFQNTMGAINQGQPLTVQSPKAEITESFRELAALVSGVSSKKKGLLSWR